MKKISFAIAGLLALVMAGDACATGLIPVRRQRVRVVERVVVEKVRVAAFVAPVQPITYVPAAAFVAPVGYGYGAPAAVRAPERIIEKYESGKLIERIVEK